MNQLKWELLAELNNRFEADLLKSYLEAEGIQVQLFQEGVGQDIYPGNIGPMAMVQLFVPKEKFDAAQDILDTYKSSDVDSGPGEDNSE
jgi:hypothetical protein